MRRFFRVPRRLLYKKYMFLNLNFIKNVRLDKTLKMIFTTIFLKIKSKYRFNYLNKKKNQKKISVLNKFDFILNLKKLYKNKKLNTQFIREKMNRKITKLYELIINLKKFRRAKRKEYSKFYSIRGFNTRTFHQRSMLNKLGKKYVGLSWLKVSATVKKSENWWVVRELKRKVAFYYGFINVKKFRYINKVNKNMAVNSNYGVKLECMLNMFILKLNLFDNIFQINNMIKKARFINIDGKLCTYPFRIINVFQTVSISKYYFKKMLNIFVKRCRFNKTYVLKNFVKKGLKRKKLLRNVVNVPNFIEYNYKIMHFTVIDKPKLSQLKSQGFGFDNSSLFTWSVDTKLKYNYK